MKTHHFSRRTFLRGLGVTMALPWMESLNVWGDIASSAKPASEAPIRLACLFSGNGFHSKEWWAKGEGADMELGQVLAPLAPHKEKLLFIQGLYELQILDSYGSSTYSNGQLGAVYKQHAPLVNPARPPLQWQSYDIVFTAPRFDAAGKLLAPARMTVLLNGVLVQNNVELKGPSVYRVQHVYAAHGPGPLVLQDHGNEGIRFRNIWIRPLSAR